MGTLALDLRSRFDVSFGLREFETREPFTCGVHKIDTLLQGGFPRAALSEIAGVNLSNVVAQVTALDILRERSPLRSFCHFLPPHRSSLLGF